MGSTTSHGQRLQAILARAPRDLHDDLITIYLVYLGIKKAYFMQCDFADVHPLDLKLIRQLGLYITTDDRVFVTRQPLDVSSLRKGDHDKVGQILGFQCVGDFNKKGKKNDIHVYEKTTDSEIIAEVCMPKTLAARRKQIIAYYDDFVNQANMALGPEFSFYWEINGPR